MRGHALILRALLVLCHVIGIWSAREVTIDDDSSLIRYEGSWARSERNLFSYGGTHVASTEPTTAKATLSFTGTAVHFLSPLWYIPIAVTLALDERPPDIVDLQTSGAPAGSGWEAETSRRRWSMTGLDNVPHTLVVTYGRPQNTSTPPAQFTIVDAFIYTVEDDPTSTTDSAPNPTTSDTAESGSGGGSNSSTTPLIAGLVSALVSTSLIAGIALFMLWRRKQKRNAQLLGVPYMTDLGSPGAHSAYPDEHSAAPPNHDDDRRNSMSEVDNTPMISAPGPKHIVLSPPTPQPDYPQALQSLEMMSNDVPATPRPRPPGNVRRSMSMKLQTPPPPYASSFVSPTSKQENSGLIDQLNTDGVHRSALGSTLSPIRQDEGEEEWLNEKSREELTELFLKADGLIKERENGSDTSVFDSPRNSPSPPTTKLRSRRTRRISMSQDDIAHLADQNSELLVKLEKLEQESAQADLSGRRALKRLEREIQHLREELEETQARGEALEEKARLGDSIEAIWRKKDREREARKRRSTLNSGVSDDDERRDFAPPSDFPRPTFKFPMSRKSESSERAVPSRAEVLREQQRLVDEEYCDVSPLHSKKLTLALIAKIAELEETNTRIMNQQAETTQRLQAVQQETENMSKVYESLGGDGALMWIGDDGTALYLDEGELDEEELDQDGYDDGSQRGSMRFRSWRRSAEARTSHGTAEGEFDQSTIRSSSQKSFGSVSERGTPSRRGSVRHRHSRGSLSNGLKRASTMGFPASHKSRKSVVGLFDTPGADKTSPTAPALGLDPSISKSDVLERSVSISPSGAQTLGAEFDGLGLAFDTTSPVGGARNVSNHHLRTTSLYDLSCIGSTSTTPMHSPSPSLSSAVYPQSASPSPVFSSLPSRMLTSPVKDSTFPVADPETPVPPGGVHFTIEEPTPVIAQGSPVLGSADGLLPSSGSKHSLRYRRMTQTVRSRAEKWEGDRFKETLKGLGSPPGRPAAKMVKRKKSTIASAFDVFMDAFADRMEKQDDEDPPLPSLEDISIIDFPDSHADGFEASQPLPPTAVLSLEQEEEEPGMGLVQTSDASLQQQRGGLGRLMLEIWLWLQFAVIILVFLWAMARRGPKAVLYEAERRKSSSSY
ncbi:hypothetical protein EYR36_006616 [Pleurotus pulmonarius]|nr:hypothetical protein EYR36_006616 [Pleurotus pulmonarius]